MNDFLPVLVLAVVLAMDAMAVAVAGGCALERMRLRIALRVGLFFGGFQALMPLVGWLAGQTVSRWVSAYGFWVAAGVLVVIGGKMIWESFKLHEERAGYNIASALTLLGFAVATSIDALAAGVSLGLLGYSLWLPVLVIGAVTFVLSFAGVMLGCRLRASVGRRMELFGGVALLLLAAKTIFEHMH